MRVEGAHTQSLQAGRLAAAKLKLKPPPPLLRHNALIQLSPLLRTKLAHTCTQRTERAAQCRKHMACRRRPAAGLRALRSRQMCAVSSAQSKSRPAFRAAAGLLCAVTAMHNLCSRLCLCVCVCVSVRTSNTKPRGILEGAFLPVDEESGDDSPDGCATLL